MPLSDFLDHTPVRSVEAGAYLFRQGDADSHIYGLRQGYLKAYYVNADGREHIKSLLMPGAFIGSVAAFADGGTCTFNLVAQTDCQVSAIPYARLRSLAAQDHGFALELVDFLTGYAHKKERREYDLLCLSATERYEAVVDQADALGGAFSQADIAGYIGITPQALSRIKRRRAEDGAGEGQTSEVAA